MIRKQATKAIMGIIISSSGGSLLNVAEIDTLKYLLLFFKATLLSTFTNDTDLEIFFVVDEENFFSTNLDDVLMSDELVEDGDECVKDDRRLLYCLV